MNLPLEGRPEFRQEVITSRERESQPFALPRDDRQLRWLARAALVGVLALLVGAVAVPVSVTRSADGVAVPAGGFAQISAPIGGQIDLRVVDGERVGAGQLLAVITASPIRDKAIAPPELQSLLDARRELQSHREATDAAAEASVQGLQRELTSARIGVQAAAQAVALQDERMRIATRRVEIIAPLVEGHYVTGMDYLSFQDQQKASAAAAIDRRDAFRAAQIKVSDLTAQLEEATKNRTAVQAESDAEIQRLGADIARARSANIREVRAPSAGYVVDLSINAGSFAEQDQPLMMVTGSLKPSAVIAYVPGSLRSDMRLGGSALVVLPSLNGEVRRIHAVVTGIGASEVRKSLQAWEPANAAGFFRVTLQLDPTAKVLEGRPLWPGQSVTVNLDLPSRTLLQRLVGLTQ